MNTKLYGVVEGNEHIMLALDGYVCDFINMDEQNHPKTSLLQKDGFILCRAIGGKLSEQFVYIYTGKDLTVKEQLEITIDLYLLSSNPAIERYCGVRFTGGILNKLYRHSQWDRVYNNDGTRSVTVTMPKDSKEFRLHGESVQGVMKIGSGVVDRTSLEKGSSLSTKDPELEIIFDHEKELETFPDVLSYVLDLCRFMAFRKNLWFSEITLLKPDDQISRFSEKMASCHVHFESSSETTKDIYRCISFNTLGECVSPLLSAIAGCDSGKMKINLDFLPEDDQSVCCVNRMRVREVVSALETELTFHNIKNQRDEELDNLLNELKQVIKNHQEGATPLKDAKEYDYLFSALGHTTSSLANRIDILMQEYQSLTMHWLKKDKIEDLVKYRNAITHGRFATLDQEMAQTALDLMGLIYCSILKRIGMDDEKIKTLFRQNILT